MVLFDWPTRAKVRARMESELWDELDAEIQDWLRGRYETIAMGRIAIGRNEVFNEPLPVEETEDFQVRYYISFSCWPKSLPFPKFQTVNASAEEAEKEANRVLNLLPKFRETHADELDYWCEQLNLSLPDMPDKAYIYPDPFRVPHMSNPPSNRIIKGPLPSRS